jgi:hypothetical protein
MSSWTTAGVDHARCVHRRDVDALGQVRAHGDEHGVEVTFGLFRHQVVDAVVGDHPHAELPDPVDLVVEHVAGQPIGGDAVAHHPARFRACVADLDLVTQLRQVIRRRQPARPAADHQHPPAAGLRRRMERPPLLPGHVTEGALHRMDRHRAVHERPVADALTRVVADPAVNRRERVVGDELPPRLLVIPCLHVRQPRLDVLPSRTARVARRQQVDVQRLAFALRPSTRMPVQQIRQPRHITQRVTHTGPWLGASEEDRAWLTTARPYAPTHQLNRHHNARSSAAMTAHVRIQRRPVLGSLILDTAVRQTSDCIRCRSAASLQPAGGEEGAVGALVRGGAGEPLERRRQGVLFDDQPP